MVIDTHSHMINPEKFDEMVETGADGAGEVVEYFERTGEQRPGMVDLETRLDQLDGTEIDLQVITPPYVADCNLLPAEPEAQLDFARVVNDGISDLVDVSEGKLLGVGTIPLESIVDGGRTEMERAINDLGLKGFSVSTNIAGRPLDHEEYEEFWAAADEMGVPVFVHPVDPVTSEGRPYEGEYGLTHNFGWPYESTLVLSRLVFSGIMERYSSLDVIGHHLGGMIPFFFGRTQEFYRPSRLPDTLDETKSLHEYFSRFYFDTAIGGHAPAIRCGRDTFGADRILFATDAPYGPNNGVDRMREYPMVVRSLDLSADEEDLIFRGNAEALFGTGS